MNRYLTRLFEANNLEGEGAGGFVGFEGGWDMDEWMESCAQEGYTLKSVQPVAYDGSLYVVATMELVDLDTNNGGE